MCVPIIIPDRIVGVSRFGDLEIWRLEIGDWSFEFRNAFVGRTEISDVLVGGLAVYRAENLILGVQFSRRYAPLRSAPRARELRSINHDHHVSR